jgi:integrase
VAVGKRGTTWWAKVRYEGEQIWLGGSFATRKDAERAERKALTQIDEGTFVPPAGRKRREQPGTYTTCDGFANAYLELYGSSLKDGTKETYRPPLRAFAREFEGVGLAELAEDRLRARAWAVKQPRNSRNVIQTMFQQAVRDVPGVTTNPFKDLKIEGKNSRGRKDLLVLSQAEVHELAHVGRDFYGADAYGAVMEAIVLTLAYTGMRPGELSAVEWTDIEGDMIHVRQARNRLRALDSPKNGRDRWVYVPPPAMAAIRRMPRVHERWVFTSKTGGPLNQGTLFYVWEPVRAAAGRPGMDPYELRHFCATYLLERGLSAYDVSIQLGHTDKGALVMKVYGHPDEERARDRIRSLWSDEGGDPTGLRLVA